MKLAWPLRRLNMVSSSYYLMRGMEGDADTNQDNKITMNEMRDYVKDKGLPIRL